jgi:hypothetical protein
MRCFALPSALSPDSLFGDHSLSTKFNAALFASSTTLSVNLNGDDRLYYFVRLDAVGETECAGSATQS